MLAADSRFSLSSTAEMSSILAFRQTRRQIHRHNGQLLLFFFSLSSSIVTTTKGKQTSSNILNSKICSKKKCKTRFRSDYGSVSKMHRIAVNERTSFGGPISICLRLQNVPCCRKGRTQKIEIMFRKNDNWTQRGNRLNIFNFSFSFISQTDNLFGTTNSSYTDVIRTHFMSRMIAQNLPSFHRTHAQLCVVFVSPLLIHATRYVSVRHCLN